MLLWAWHGTRYVAFADLVPFTYNAEAFPIAVRELGMSYGTAVLWLFNGLLSIVWFRLVRAFTSTGAFGFYAGLCALLWVLIFFFVPETKGLTLEEVDAVFSEKSIDHASRQVGNATRVLTRKSPKQAAILRTTA